MGKDKGITNRRITHYSKNDLYTMMYWMERRNAAICRIRGVLSPTIDSFFQEVSASLRFPDYFGWNWDAFDECMTDLDWLQFSEIDIVIDDYSKMFNKAPDREIQKELLIKHLEIVWQYWEEQKMDINIIINDED